MNSGRCPHDLELAAASEHLAALLGEDARHEVGVFLVFDRFYNFAAG